MYPIARQREREPTGWLAELSGIAVCATHPFTATSQVRSPWPSLPHSPFRASPRAQSSAHHHQPPSPSSGPSSPIFIPYHFQPSPNAEIGFNPVTPGVGIQRVPYHPPSPLRLCRALPRVQPCAITPSLLSSFSYATGPWAMGRYANLAFPSHTNQNKQKH